ncbi:MAG: UDP-N-acetylmuramoyl-L-alanyl-D-glutamate--2,6-diaminopimelate ligase [Candidatus Daviesbacteria bacterium]
MIRKIRKLIPNSVVNLGKHLPEAILANVKYGFPGKKLKIIGVSGTDGKTTTVNMLYQILQSAGKKVSMISTINAVIGGKSYDTGFHVTSPKSSDVQNYLKKAVASGDEIMILEVTSHASDQFRFWGIKFDIGVITNVTSEHLDYHQTFENYLKAKIKLIKNVGHAILNLDDLSFDRLSRSTTGKVITFGQSKNADLNPGNFLLNLKVPGDFNVLNALAAAVAARTLGINDELIKKSLESFTGLTGRMEEIKNNQGLKIIVDFAHTPNALEQALQTLKDRRQGKLISVFGCASERDRQKRPLMGEISAKISDITILTDEDPRFENSEKIIEEIAKGCYRGGALDGKTLFKEPDREKAIKLALKIAQKGDTVGIFGKGHEKSMNYKGVEKPWSDQAEVLKNLKNG